MSGQRSAHENVASYLRRHGWSVADAGPAGEMWRITEPERNPSSIAVPFDVAFDSFEYNSVASRIARHLNKTVGAVNVALESEFTDTHKFRVADAELSDGAAPLAAATALLASAKKLFRASATTARKPRPHINGNFSKPGDEIARLARLAHTRLGSFVLPVEMPVTPPPAEDGQIDDASVSIEPAERSVTRTLASALAAIDALVVQPDRAPTPSEVSDLVQSGVSWETISAVRDVTVSAGIDSFDVSFDWSPALGTPKNVPERVVVPDEAAPLLRAVSEKLRQMNPEPDAVVSGQIVRIQFVQDDPFGEIAIRTERSSREVDIAVTLNAETVHRAYEWARDHRSVLVRGRIERLPGKPLSIPSPESIVPVDSLFANSSRQVEI